MINNATEELIEMLLNDILKHDPGLIHCPCDMCLDDIRALTLNNVPTKYYAHTAGSAFLNYALFERQNKTTATSELIHAIRLVNEKPRHETHQ